MSLSKLGVFTSLALAASAVLIPPGITATDLNTDAAFQAFAIDPSRRSFALECSDCAVATLNGKTLSWKGDVGNAFLLDFAVGPHEDTLDIDGVQLYPPSFEFGVQPFHVTQIDPNGEDDLALRVTGYKFHFSSAETVTEDGMELLPMTFQIISIESTPVHPPEVTINLLKDANGRLMIASFRSKDAVEGGLLEEEDCKQWPLVCEWKSIVADRIEKLKSMGKGKGKGCHKGHEGLDGEHHSPMQEETLEGKPPHRFRPGRPHPHHRPHHGHHHHGHQFQMFFRRAFFTILIPIAVGIFAGTLTYLVGMALGCLIAIAIAKVRGQEYQRVALEEDVEEGEVGGEKEEYAELPAYEAPPVYENATESVESAVKPVDGPK